jgi:cyclic pyranopterin phosphate synthase
MDAGNLNPWSTSKVVASAVLLKMVHDKWPLRPVASTLVGETARPYEFVDGAGEIGFISSISEPFCGDCTRARVTADGVFYSCLFAASGTELRPLLRNGIDENALFELLEGVWTRRDDRYSESRGSSKKEQSKVEMFRMGG